MKKSHQLILLASAVATTALANAAKASSISVQLWDNTYAGDNLSLTYPTTNAGAVPVPGSDWNAIGAANNVAGFTTTFSQTTFTDSTGSTSNTMTVAGGESEVFTTGPESNANEVLVTNMFGTNGSEAYSVTISSVPYATYDLYVYATSNTTSNTALNSVTDGTSTFYSYGISNTLTSLVEMSTSPLTTSPGNYAEFVESNANPVVLSVTRTANQFGFTGFQIVDATPEPTAAAAIGVACALLGLTRRRKREAAE